MRTEPAPIGLDAGVGELLGLEIVLQHLPLAIALRPRVVHLEPPHRGRGADSLVASAIAAVHVERVLRLPRDVDLLLLLLLHHG